MSKYSLMGLMAQVGDVELGTMGEGPVITLSNPVETGDKQSVVLRLFDDDDAEIKAQASLNDPVVWLTLEDESGAKVQRGFDALQLRVWAGGLVELCDFTKNGWTGVETRNAE